MHSGPSALPTHVNQQPAHHKVDLKAMPNTQFIMLKCGLLIDDSVEVIDTHSN